MNNRGQMGYILIIILLIIIVIVILILGVYMYKTNKLDFLFGKKEVEALPILSLLLYSTDFYTKEFTSSKFLIKSISNNTLYFKEYESIDYPLKIDVIKNTTYIIMSYSDECYAVKSVIGIDDREHNLNNNPDIIHTTRCPKKENNLSIELKGELNNFTTNNLKLYLNSTINHVRNFDLCFAYSVGIISMNVINFDNKTIKPSFINKEADMCVRTGNFLDNETTTREYDLQVKVDEVKDKDWIRVYVIDRDTFYNFNINDFDYGIVNERGEDIGLKTPIKTFFKNEIKT